jgi:protein gp37
MKGIEYLDRTYNPVSMRCTRCSPGCLHCWHLTICKRLAKNPSIYGPDQRAYAGGPFVLNQKKLEAPLHWRKPAMVGLQFMGDWMHDGVHLTWIDQILEVISACPQHTFFSLTKRPENFSKKLFHHKAFKAFESNYLSNLWLGVTVCDNSELWKVAELLKIQWFKKWISIEPMLGEIIFEKPWRHLLGPASQKRGMNDGLDWIVAGAETGPGSRPAHPDWFRSLRDQCQAAGVPFFLKKLSYGGRTLDGQEWNELPKEAQ